MHITPNTPNTPDTGQGREVPLKQVCGSCAREVLSARHIPGPASLRSHGNPTSAGRGVGGVTAIRVGCRPRRRGRRRPPPRPGCAHDRPDPPQHRRPQRAAAPGSALPGPPLQERPPDRPLHPYCVRSPPPPARAAHVQQQSLKIVTLFMGSALGISPWLGGSGQQRR